MSVRSAAPAARPLRGRFAAVATALLLAVFAAAPLAAYTIYFVDGTRVIAKEKYRVEDGKAYIVLQNGTEVFYDASKIDVERTEKANRVDYGNALVIEGGEVREMTAPPAPPPRRSPLADLIERGEAGPGAAREESAPTPPTGTAAGEPEAGAAPPRPYADREIAGAVVELFRSQGLDEVRVLAGRTGERPRLDVVTSSEAAVFRALVVAASSLLQLRDRHPGEVAALELTLHTAEGANAGRFVITPEAAEQLLTRRIDVASFFLEHVRF